MLIVIFWKTVKIRIPILYSLKDPPVHNLKSIKSSPLATMLEVIFWSISKKIEAVNGYLLEPATFMAVLKVGSKTYMIPGGWGVLSLDPPPEKILSLDPPKKFMTPPPPSKIFLRPLPPPQDFWPGSCMFNDCEW